jgi:hypothetical protein
MNRQGVRPISQNKQQNKNKKNWQRPVHKNKINTTKNGDNVFLCF